MFVDASALVAIIANESDGASLAARLLGAQSSFTSPVAIYEAALGLRRIRDTTARAAVALVIELLQDTRTEVVAIDAEIGRAAIEAFDRFRRGNHPARLNLGDCFAYACARNLGVPLLCKGDDFPQTDIELA